MLTGRDHLRLQSTLQGISRAERKPRANELLERVGLSRGGRSQGRRLLGRDEAPARPRARARPPAADPLPRRADDRARHPEPHGALGGGRPARARGRRHRLPDHAVPGGGGRARRTGSGSSTTGTSSPRARRPRSRPRSGCRACTRSPPRRPIASGSSPRSLPSARRSAARRARSPCGCAKGSPGSPAVVRAVDDAGLTLASLEIQAPSLDDVFLAKTGRSLEGAAEAEADEADDRGVSRPEPLAADRRARVALDRPHEPPARGGRLPADLPDAAPARELGRAQGVDEAARLPHRFLPRVRARGPVHPGRALLDDERGHRPREGHPDGLPEPPLADLDARVCADRGPARRRGRPRPHPGCVLHRRRPGRRRRLRVGRARDPRALRLRRRRSRSASAPSASSSRSAPARARRSRGSSRSSSSSSSSPR